MSSAKSTRYMDELNIEQFKGKKLEGKPFSSNVINLSK